MVEMVFERVMVVGVVMEMEVKREKEKEGGK